MKNIYIYDDGSGDLKMIGHKDQLDLWLKDGSINEGDAIYTVKDTYRAKVDKKIRLAKEANDGK